MVSISESIFALSLAGVAGASWAAYSGDRTRAYSRGKADSISAIAGAKVIVTTCFYAAIAIAAAVLIAPDSKLLLRVWRSDTAMMLGSAIAIAGEALFLAAKFTLGANYSPCFDSFMPVSVTRGGVYRFSRHPLYVGNATVFVGAFVATGSIWCLALLTSIVGLYARTIRVEEQSLSQVPEYLDYKRQTPLLLGFPRSD